MHITKCLLRSLTVLGIGAVAVFAQRTDYYTLGSGVVSFDTLDEETVTSGLIPYFYTENMESSIDESEVGLIGDMNDPLKSLYGIKLNTEGDTVQMRLTETNTPNLWNGINFGEKTIYIDTMMQFVPSEDPPGPGETTEAKLALYVDAATSNLVIRHGMPLYTDGLGLVTDEWDIGLWMERGAPDVIDTIVSGRMIETGTWYNVKVVLQDCYDESVGAVQAFQVYIDGVAVTGAFGDDWATEAIDAINSVGPMVVDPAGTWFLSAASSGASSAGFADYRVLETLSFKGTGAVADISIYETPTYTITLDVETSGGGTGGTVTFHTIDGTDTNLLANLTEIAAGTEIMITVVTNPTYQIDSLTLDEVDFANGGTFVINSDVIVEVVFSPVGGGQGAGYQIPTELGSTTKYDSWLQSKGVLPSDNLTEMDAALFCEAYLLDIDPRDVSATHLVIDSFELTDTACTGELVLAYVNKLETATNAVPTVNAQTAYATLFLVGSQDLATWTDLASQDVTINDAPKTFSFPKGASRFFKVELREKITTP